MRLLVIAAYFVLGGVALAQQPATNSAANSPRVSIGEGGSDDLMTLPQQRKPLPPNLEHSTNPLVTAKKHEAILKSEALTRPSSNDVWAALQQGMQDKAQQTIAQDQALASVRAQVLAIANHAADLQERLDAMCDRFDKDHTTEFCGQPDANK